METFSPKSTRQKVDSVDIGSLGGHNSTKASGNHDNNKRLPLNTQAVPFAALPALHLKHDVYRPFLTWWQVPACIKEPALSELLFMK